MEGSKQQEPPGKRLMIRQMVLENFKSYAGEQQVGPFHKCFSSVVGPNGSGKSNVIDAMLFVFGKRAKQLRLNKVSELIHNSTHHRNLDVAKVSVYFQEIVDTSEETFDVVPNSDFVVSRTAHRNNTSNYYIDSRRSNFGEVTVLLKSKGIDLDNNRFLILQGEVEQISMMKPKALTQHETGLLEYLEDIVGTDKYVEHIEEGAKRLEEMNEKRQTMVQRLRIVERERDALEGGRAAAEAYLGKEQECTQSLCMVAQMQVREGARNINIIEERLSEFEAKLKYESDKMQSYSTDLKQAEKKYNAESKVQAGIQAELDRANGTFKEFERKDIKMREDIKHLKAKLKKLTDKLTKDAASVQASSKKAEEAEADAPRLAKEGEELTKQLASEEKALEKMYDSIKGEVEGYQKALQKVKGELAPWQRQMAEVQSKFDVAAFERNLLVQKQTDAEGRLQTAESGLAEAIEAAIAIKREIRDMQDAAKKHRGEATSARQTAAAAAAEAEKLDGSLREVRGRLEQRRSNCNAQKSQGAIVKALMEAKASGEITGIYGRLGDLGAIDKQYDIAVSTACGALDFIVVEDTAAAQRCVERLRKCNLGVATFLLLDKQRSLAKAAAEKVSPPEGVKRLYDLISVQDNALRVAFFYGLRNTLVATSLDQASRIAYSPDRRWGRVVTLQGEMINESGTMSGGGGKPKGGRMCLGNAAPRARDTKEAAAELANAETDFAATRQALEEARSRGDAATATARNAEKALAALELDVAKSEMDVQAKQQRAEDLRQRLAELKAATKIGADDAKQLKVLEASIAAAEKELQKLEKSASGPQAKAEELQGKIDNAGGEPLKKKKQLIATLQEGISKAEEGAARKKVEAQAARKQVEKLLKEVAKGEKDKAKAESDIEQLNTANQELEEAALKVVEAHKEINGLLEEKNAELAIIKEEYETKKKGVNIIRTVEVELQNKIADQRSALEFENRAKNANTKRVQEYRKKLSKMMQTEDLPSLLTDEEMDKHKLSELSYRVNILEEELGRMRPDMGAIEAYRKKEADYMTRVKELEAATAERDEVRRAYEELRKRRLNEFMSGFNVISMKLKEMYQMITLGGDAELELVDSLDPFSEGIVFSVRPPKKSWKNIANLSGGEKTLSSLSLVFALHHYKPTPLYVMDEIDAALDFKNVSIVAHYIKERTKNAQFVIISLRNNMFELADRLVGIYKTENATKSVTINPQQFAVGETSSANFRIALPAM